MDISEIAHLDRPSARELLDGAPPAVVRVMGDGTGVLLMGGAGARPGNRYRLVDRASRGLRLGEALSGRPASADGRAVPPTGPGDVVMLEAARGTSEGLLCGAVAARMHDQLRGEAQAVYALARPTRLSVSRFGATQFVKLLDPSRAHRAATRDEVAAAAAELVSAAWLGGRAGFLVRNAHRPPGRMAANELAASQEFDAEPGETAEAFARRLVEVERILERGEGEYALAGGAVELIPTSVMPVGREQMFREGGNLSEPAAARVGNHGRQYVVRGRLGFVPSFVIVGDEPEFKFKAPTGAYERRCVGLEPRAGVAAVGHAGIATAVRPIGAPGKPYPVIAPAVLFKGNEAAEMAAARSARRGPDPDPVPQAARPGSRAPFPRTGSAPAPRATVAARPLARMAPDPAPRGGLAGLAGLAGLGSGDLDDDPGFWPG
jgi:hypothetical protein